MQPMQPLLTEPLHYVYLPIKNSFLCPDRILVHFLSQETLYNAGQYRVSLIRPTDTKSRLQEHIYANLTSLLLTVQ